MVPSPPVAEIELPKVESETTPEAKHRARIELKKAVITRVVDGDTAWVRFTESGKNDKVRFIGVDTPENTIQVEAYGAEASRYAKKHLASETVYLETDAEKRDRYDRLLAYVWMSKPVEGDSDGRPTFVEAKKRMFNAWLARDGYAQTLTIPPNVKYEDYFLRLQRSAREHNRGLWNPMVATESEKSTPRTGSYIGNRNSMKFHEGSCRWVSAMSESNKVGYKSRKAAIRDGYVPCKVCNP